MLSTTANWVFKLCKTAADTTAATAFAVIGNDAEDDTEIDCIFTCTDTGVLLLLNNLVFRTVLPSELETFFTSVIWIYSFFNFKFPSFSAFRPTVYWLNYAILYWSKILNTDLIIELKFSGFIRTSSPFSRFTDSLNYRVHWTRTASVPYDFFRSISLYFWTLLFDKCLKGRISRFGSVYWLSC